MEIIFRQDLNDFAEARESMIHVFGIQQYADMMSAFAAGEQPAHHKSTFPGAMPNTAQVLICHRTSEQAAQAGSTIAQL